MLDVSETRTPVENAVMKALEDVIDPELGVDMVNLGLIYHVKVEEQICQVDMTLTTMGCPLGNLLDDAITDAVTSVDGVEHCQINLIWEPAWHMGMMTRFAKVALGIHE
ncbi:metal-sulfur cluster assembly factor [Levilactobacillus brevis]|uniref:metal-sulfur cluster assembly factor n=1 Tax=Levilactobacillus brevis TaxID=1580 RepID=UPI000B3F71E3|nr:metal-sulfur cluster assembly factor [Levilactobacillus brevis]STX18575.1 FeS assembly SUF system protein [Levilactobacillus brevis]